MQQIQSQVDDALDRLADHDRRAIVLRYYSAKSFGEIGNALNITEDSARKRVERALDKLRAILARRGITSTAGAVSAALTGNAATTAPAAFGSSVAGAALSAATATGLWFVAGSYKIAMFGASAAVFAATAILVHQFKHTSLLREESERAHVTIAALRADLAEAQRSVQVYQAHARQAEEDATLLLGAIRQTDVSSTTSSPFFGGAPDRALVDRRYREAREHARAGRHAEALEGFLWCFDEGMPAVPSYAGVRVSFLVGELQKLASVYPPALTAIRARRDRAEQAMVAEAGEKRHSMEFAALNDALGEEERSVTAFFQMEDHDPRRAAMEHRVMSALVEQRRYPEAARILSIDGILLEFERRKTNADRAGIDEKSLSLLRRSTIAKYVAYVEVLTGAGKPREAQRLIDAIVRWDRSEHATLSLRAALQRSGRGEQLTVP
jgi:hypothetical protein